MINAANDRYTDLNNWTQKTLVSDHNSEKNRVQLHPIGGDAGFRKYYRLQVPKGTLLAVDAPPLTEDSDAFAQIAKLLSNTGIRVPDIQAIDTHQGFLLIEDFGDNLLQKKLSKKTVDAYYRQAFSVLRKIHATTPDTLPVYDDKLLAKELNIYSDWFLNKLLNITLSNDDIKIHNELFTHLISTATQQPQRTVHRDFHSRNLIVLPDDELGVIDFQGAVYGPATYDVVSLLKDCYIRWPAAKTIQWLRQFVQTDPQLRKKSFEDCQKWFDWMGLQRHLKCLGIFSRLWLRDGKPNYLPDIPNTFAYVQETCQHYTIFSEYADWLNRHVAPIMTSKTDITKTEAHL